METASAAVTLTEPTVDQETAAEETETFPDEESAAPEEASAATEIPQVEVPAEKPEYMTKADWEREKADVASRAAADALEADRRKRQTENARRAQAEQREREEQQEAADTIRAAFVAQGFDPSVVTDEHVTRAVDRLARKKADRIANGSVETLDQAFDYIVAPITGASVDLDDAGEAAARRLAPKVQHLIDTMVPQIEAKAREGYVLEADMSKRVDAEIARRNAKAREGETELVRPNGVAPSSVMSWSTYINLTDAEKLAMTPAQRSEIMAADRKARLGQ